MTLQAWVKMAHRPETWPGGSVGVVTCRRGAAAGAPDATFTRTVFIGGGAGGKRGESEGQEDACHDGVSATWK